MGSQRGQATVEWIGLVLLLALGLGALARLAPRADGTGLAGALLHSVTCAARGGCGAERVRRAASGAPKGLVTVPPLVTVAPGERRAKPPRSLRGPRLDPRMLARVRRGAGVAWRRAWMFCFAYERVRYALLHPEMRFPGQTIPAAEELRMANDCLSPVDLIRDRDLLLGPR